MKKNQFLAIYRVLASITFLILPFIYGYTANIQAQICTPAPVGLVSWHSGNGNTLDSRSRNHGTLQNGATFSPGKVGQGFSFDGGNDYLQVNDNSELNFGTGDFSVEFWININGAQLSPNSEYGIINKNANYQDSPGWGFEFSTYSGNFPNPRIEFYETRTLWGLTNVVSPITVNTWHHVVAMRQGGDTNKLYIDGVLVASRTEGFFIYGNISNSQPLLLGAWSGTFFPGQLDEISIYNRALSANEVQTLYNADTNGKCKPTATNAPSGVVGWWSGDGNANDISGNSNNGTLQNGAGFEIGKVGQSFALGGGYIEVIDSPALEVTTQLTIECWIKPADTTQFRQIVSKFGFAGNYAYQIGLAPNGALRTDLSEDGGPVYVQMTTPPNVITANVWNHIAMTFNGGVTTLYVNGNSVSAATLPINSIFGSGNTNLNIGRDPTGVQYFVGIIDEVAIYDRALTDNEIASVFNAGIAGKLKEKTTPIGSNVAVNTKSDATVTFPNVTTAGMTQQIPLDSSLLPALPNGATSAGLTYDISTGAIYSGNVDICFNLPALPNPQFANLRVYHLENGVWINRTATNNTFPTLCTSGITSLSPFAIAAFAPTAANVSVAGRVMRANGNGLRNAKVQMTDSNGNIRTAMTTTFGYYRFDDVSVGETYVFEIRSKQFQFSPQVVSVIDNLTDLDFTALP